MRDGHRFARRLESGVNTNTAALTLFRFYVPWQKKEGQSNNHKSDHMLNVSLHCLEFEINISGPGLSYCSILDNAQAKPVQMSDQLMISACI